MTFQGGDTESMRGQSERFTTAATDLTTHLTALGATVQAVSWNGPDADALRDRCGGVVRQGHVLGEQIAELSRALEDHAEEQDRASSAASEGPRAAIDGFLGRSGAGIGELLGTTGILGTGLLSGMRPSLDGAGGVGGVDGGLLPNAMNTMTPVHDGGAPGQPDHGELDDEVTVPDENGSITRSGTLAGDGDSLTVASTESGDGSTTESVTLTDQQQKFGNDAISGSLSRSAEVAVTHDPESGTVSYTFEVAAIEKGGIEAKDGGTGAGVEGTATESTSYTVTLPEGASITDALAIDLSDPTSLPPGGSFAIESSLTAELAGSGSVVTGGIQFGAEVAQSESVSTVTEISRAQDGTFEMAVGEIDAIGTTGGVSIGIPKAASLEVGPSVGTESSTVEHAVFADTPEGRAQMQNSYDSSTFPTETSDAVLERYQDVHTASTSGAYIEGKLGNDDLSVSGSVSTEGTTYESVERTHSDGHQEGIERVQQEGASSYIEARTETGEEKLYVMATDQDSPRQGSDGTGDPTVRDTYDDFYSPVADSSPTEAQDSRVVYTEREIQQMRANEDPTSPSDSELGYLWNRSSEDPTRAAESMYRDYNGLDGGEPIPQGVSQQDPDVPGQSLVPDQPVSSAY